MKSFLYYLVVCFSLFSINSFSQNNLDQSIADAFSNWCKIQAEKVDLQVSPQLLNEGKCKCAINILGDEVSKSRSYTVEMSKLKEKVADASTLLGKKQTEIRGNLGFIAAFFYDILGQSNATISWSQEGIYHSVIYTQNYTPGYNQPGAQEKAASEAKALAESLSKIYLDLPSSTLPSTDTETSQQKPVSKKEEAEDDPIDESKPDGSADKPTLPPKPPIDQSNSESKDDGYAQIEDVNDSSGIQIGLIAGVSLNSLAYDFGLGSEISGLSKIGYSAGFLVKAPITQRFSIQFPLTYKIKGEEAEASFIYDRDHQYLEFEELEGTGTIIHELGYIEFPLVFDLCFPMENSAISIGLGPFVAYGIGGKEKNDYTITSYITGYPEYSIIVDQDRTIKFGDSQNFNNEETKYLEQIDYGAYGQVAYSKHPILIGASISYGLANINYVDDWTIEYGSIEIPEVKTVSAGLFLTYFIK